MANPNLERRHLKAGKGGKRPGAGRKAEDDPSRKISRSLIMRPLYQANLADQLDRGVLHPSVQCMLWYYALGKPKEVIETKQVTPVRIVHEYTKDDDDKDKS